MNFCCFFIPLAFAPHRFPRARIGYTRTQRKRVLFLVKRFFLRMLKIRLLYISLGLVILAGALVMIAFRNLTPLLVAMSEARAKQLAVEAINQAVDEVMDENLSYDALVTAIPDENGQIAMLVANTMKMNDLASAAALAAQRNLGELEDQGVELPLGSALGISLFSGMGPDIRVSVVPVGSVTTRFVTKFESAGINQTRHEISLEATTTMRIVIPTGTDTIQVTSTIPIAESIIVGTVPESYVNVPDVDSMLNMAP